MSREALPWDLPTAPKSARRCVLRVKRASWLGRGAVGFLQGGPASRRIRARFAKARLLE